MKDRRLSLNNNSIFDTFFNSLANDEFFSSPSLFNKNQQNFPPFNISKIDENGEYYIELALAGYKKEDIDIKLTPKKQNHRFLDAQELEISASTSNEEHKDEKDYHYRGIATRKFVKSYLIDGSDEVQDCTFENGVLKILIKRHEEKDRDTKYLEIK